MQDPLTRTGTFPNITSTPFAGNQIPANRFDKNSVLLMSKFFPLPNQPATAGLPNRNYQYLVKTPVDKNQFNQRIDFSESPNSQWFGRYSWTDELTINPGTHDRRIEHSTPGPASGSCPMCASFRRRK